MESKDRQSSITEGPTHSKRIRVDITYTPTAVTADPDTPAFTFDFDNSQVQVESFSCRAKRDREAPQSVEAVEMKTEEVAETLDHELVEVNSPSAQAGPSLDDQFVEGFKAEVKEEVDEKPSDMMLEGQSTVGPDQDTVSTNGAADSFEAEETKLEIDADTVVEGPGSNAEFGIIKHSEGSAFHWWSDAGGEADANSFEIEVSPE